VQGICAQLKVITEIKNKMMMKMMVKSHKKELSRMESRGRGKKDYSRE
jgi:hypothetical protein